MAEHLDEQASVLARLLAHFQISAGQGQPLPVLQAHVALIHKVSGELLAQLAIEDPATPVHINPYLQPGVADLLSEYLGDSDTPDHIPDDWQ